MTDYTTTPPVLDAHVLDHRGCALHYWLAGPSDRPLVTFTHGATMDHRMFNAQVEALASDYRMLVWDARGHGQSRPMHGDFSLELCARDLLAIMDAIGADEAVHVGQSMGAYVGQTLYMLAPERVRAMAFIGATPLTKAYPQRDIWALKGTMPLFDLWPYGHLTKTIANATAHTAEVKAYALHACRQIPRADFLRIWKAITLAIDAKGKPGFTFDVPLLLAHGEFDRTGSIKRDMQPWAQREPQATFHLIPQAGHNANQDNPPVTNRLLHDFLVGVTR